MLFYREALALDRRRSSMRVADVNAGMAGGKAARDRLAQLARKG